MEQFLTTQTYESICSQWARTIMLLSESEIHVWIPLSRSFLFIRRFLNDVHLQKKLFGELQPTLVLIDGYELEHISFEDIEKQFQISLGLEKGMTLDAYLSIHPHLLGLFITGTDTALKHKNSDAFKRIGTLLEKHSHLSLIFITEQNLLDLPVFHDLLLKQMLVQNIYYQGLFSLEDSLSYVSYLQDGWKFVLAKGLDKLIAQNVGGHLLLLEEAVRIARDNPLYSIQNILTSPSLVRKALAIFHLLSASDQKTIHSLLFQPRKQTKPSEYLLKTLLVKDGKIGIHYWSYLAHNVLESTDFTQENSFSPEYHLTSSEQKVLILVRETSGLTKRETVSEAIWGENWELHYSDWALGQFIHRLREKLDKNHAPFTIETKKGEGFYLVEK